MKDRRRIDEVKHALALRMEEAARKLLPGGKVSGGKYRVNHPADREKQEPALQLAVRGAEAGAWRCWRSGDHGDSLAFVALALGRPGDIRAALAWAEDFCGLKSLSLEQRRDLQKQAVQRRQKDEQDEAEKRERRRRAAFDLWASGDAPQEEAAARGAAELHARAYFAARRCPLEDVPGLAARTFRFHPACEWWRGAQWHQNARGYCEKKMEGPAFPAVLSAMVGPTGQFVTVHVTWLDALKPAKAPVAKPKLVRSSSLGAIICVSDGLAEEGAGGNPFAPGATPAPVVLAEGIETALTLAAALPQARVWACGSLAGIGHAPVHLPSVSNVIFARDNNTGNKQAQRQFAAALALLEASDKPVRVIASPEGDDFNDLATRQ